MPKSDFSKNYLEALVKNHQEKILKSQPDPAERLLAHSGSLLNWVGEYINDKSINWQLKRIPIDSLTLTGTGPEWNEITIKKAERKPAKLRKLLQEKKVKNLFKKAQFTDVPILVRKENDKLKVLDGMNRTIAAIRDGKQKIRAYIGIRKGKPKPQIEPHVIYDFIRAFQQRKGNEEDFKAGLRFLTRTYSNTRKLLKTRFGPRWVDDKKINKLINEVLK